MYIYIYIYICTYLYIYTCMEAKAEDTNAEIIAKMINKGCDGKQERKEAFGWIRRRERKSNSEGNIHYKRSRNKQKGPNRRSKKLQKNRKRRMSKKGGEKTGSPKGRIGHAHARKK